MFGTFLTHGFEFRRLLGATAAGAADITTAASVDMLGYDTATFIFSFGAIVAGAATSVKIQQSSDDGSSDAFADLAGSGITVADDGDNKLYISEIKNPRERYLKPIVLRATQNSSVDGIWVILQGARKRPVTQGATVGATEQHEYIAEGTA